MNAKYAQVETKSEKQLSYPKSVFFIIGNEFCERYSAYALGAILVLYLRNALHYTEDEARLIFHTLLFLCYFFPIFGAILADSYIGKFKTLLYMSAVHGVGNITIALAATEWLFNPRVICLTGLFLLAVGVGGIKPCVATFGGDQFVMPQQAQELKRFFSIFYFTNNVGGLIAALTSPILRQDVKCFGQSTCYPLAFGIPAFLMVIALVLFICGKPWYKVRKPEGNILADSLKCIFCALRKKLSAKDDDGKKPSHWLEYAEGEFNQQLIKDVKEALGVIVMYVPVVIYMALADQQGSSWIFQASQMDGVVFNWLTIKPDQLGVLNPLLCLIFIPLYETMLYPLLKKVGIKRPLQYITIGAALCGVAFVIAAIVEYKLEPSYAVLPVPGSGQLRIFNGLPCQIELDPPISGQSTIPPLGALQVIDVEVTNGTNGILKERLRIDAEAHCSNVTIGSTSWTEEIAVYEAQSTSYAITLLNDQLTLLRVPGHDDVSKALSNAPRVRVISNLNGSLTLINQYDSTFHFSLSGPQHVPVPEEIYSGSYVAILNNEIVMTDLLMESGGVYTLVLQKIGQQIVGNLHIITPPATLHMLWTFPQIFVVTMAEIFFVVTYLSFTFTEAPESMKSLMTSVLYVSDALGNLLVVIISEISFFRILSPAQQFLFYAGLMVLNIAILIALAVPYKYRKYKSVEKLPDYTLVDGKKDIPMKEWKTSTHNSKETIGKGNSENGSHKSISFRDQSGENGGSVAGSVRFTWSKESEVGNGKVLGNSRNSVAETERSKVETIAPKLSCEENFRDGKQEGRREWLIFERKSDIFLIFKNIRLYFSHC